MERNIKKLLQVTRNLEEKALEDLLAIQHGEYVFPVPVPVGIRMPGETPCDLKVTRAWHVNEEYEPDANYIEGTLSNGQQITVNISCQYDLFPGEILKIAESVPDHYIDPELVDRGWKTFGGRHEVNAIWDKTAEVIFNASNKTIHVKGADGERHVYEGADAKEKVYEIMWDFRTKTNTEAMRKSAVQRFYDHLGIDLPF